MSEAERMREAYARVAHNSVMEYQGTWDAKHVAQAVFDALMALPLPPAAAPEPAPGQGVEAVARDVRGVRLPTEPPPIDWVERVAKGEPVEQAWAVQHLAIHYLSREAAQDVDAVARELVSLIPGAVYDDGENDMLSKLRKASWDELARHALRREAAARREGVQSVIFALRELGITGIAAKHGLHLLGYNTDEPEKPYAIQWERFRNVWRTLELHAREVAPAASKAQDLYEGGAEDLARDAAFRVLEDEGYEPRLDDEAIDKVRAAVAAAVRAAEGGAE